MLDVGEIKKLLSEGKTALALKELGKVKNPAVILLISNFASLNHHKNLGLLTIEARHRKLNLINLAICEYLSIEQFDSTEVVIDTNELNRLLDDEEIEKAIALFNQKGLTMEGIMLSARYNKLKRDIALDVISPEAANTLMNQIRAAIKNLAS